MRRLLLTAEEVAEVLAVPPSSIRRGFGPPPCEGIGRRLRWYAPAVRRWAREHQGGAPCQSSSDAQGPSTSGSGSRSKGASSSDPRVRRIVEKLRRAPRRSRQRSESGAEVVQLRPGTGRRLAPSPSET